MATRVTDGNRADQIWDKDMAKWLTSWMSEESRETTLLVADSALVTKVAMLDREGYRFVSRLPNTLIQAAVARADALYGDESRWQDLDAL